jgi:hypothetical protein
VEAVDVGFLHHKPRAKSRGQLSTYAEHAVARGVSSVILSYEDGEGPLRFAATAREQGVLAALRRLRMTELADDLTAALTPRVTSSPG